MTRRLTVVFALLATLAAACALTWSLAGQRGAAQLQRNAAVRADRTVNALKNTLERYETLTYLLAGHPLVQDVLADPKPAEIARANRYLEDLNRQARATETYLIRPDGLCVAASNWNQPDSFVGFQYRFRPYFIDAVKGGVGRFFGIGTTSHDPGYFVSQPVYRDGKIVGVAVVKLNLEWFPGVDAVEPLVVTDDHGVIFLSSVSAWKYHTMRPLTRPVAASIDATRQYEKQPLVALPMTVERVLSGDAQIVRVGGGLLAQRYIATIRPIGDPAWHLITMASLGPVETDARNAAVVAGLGFVSLCLVGFYWRMRRARMREMMRSRAMLQAAYAELNQRVSLRTADLSAANAQLQKEVGERTRAEQELRAAQDELVQASKLAALGQMAAGITHELNQPLAALRSFSDNTRVLLERGDQAAARENLEAIAALTARMGKITNQLKLFVGRARPRNERASVARALHNALQLLQERLQGIAVEVSLTRDDQDEREQAENRLERSGTRAPFDVNDEHALLVARCDDLRLEQMLINLIGNALDAVAGLAEPRIVIEIAASAASITITVLDNGPGISAEALPRLFEPFFTTKEMGQGLGLGLAISSSIARDCGGSLTGGNAPGGGAVFVLTLHRAHVHGADTLAL